MDLDFNSESPFYPGLFDETGKERIRKDDVWPVLLGLHHEFDLWITRWLDKGVGKVVSSYMYNGQVVLADKQGFNVLMVGKAINKNGQEFIHVSPLMGDSDQEVSLKHSFINSDAPKYILGRIKKNPDLTNQVRARQKISAGIYIPHIRTILNSFLGWTKDPALSYKFTIDELNSPWLIKLFAGDINVSEIPKDVADILLQFQTQLKEQQLAKKALMQRTIEMFNREKWLITINSASGHLIAGSMDMSPVIQTVDSYVQTGSFLKDIQIPLVEKFRRYKTIRNAPDRFRDALCGSLTLCRVAREGTGLGANVGGYWETDSDKFFPISVLQVYPDTNSIAWRNNPASDQWFMLDK
jgi:hypothetical protein